MKNPSYKNDLIATLMLVIILILANFVPRGENQILRIAGLVFFGLAVIFWAIPIFILKKYGETPMGRHYFETELLVQKNIYSIIRHPQYLAYMLLALGFASVTQNMLIGFLSLISLFFFYKQAKEEDLFLSQKFEEEFERYQRRVPMFNFFKGIYKKLSHQNRNSTD